MKYIFFIGAVCFYMNGAAQVSLQKVPVMDSEASLYVYAPMEWEKTYSEDSSEMYLGSFELDAYEYNAIVVKLKGMENETKEDLENLLISYLDYLQGVMNVLEATGYGKGHTLASTPSATGVIDYWLLANGNEVKLKAWINQDFIAVLYVEGEDIYSKTNQVDIFLDGFRFPNKK